MSTTDSGVARISTASDAQVGVVDPDVGDGPVELARRPAAAADPERLFREERLVQLVELHVDVHAFPIEVDDDARRGSRAVVGDGEVGPSVRRDRDR